MKFTWLPSELPFMAANTFEGLSGPLRCNIRYMLHQIQQNRHDETESKKSLQNRYDCLVSIWSKLSIYNKPEIFPNAKSTIT